MCGIAGYISRSNDFSEQRFKQAASLLNHRGPDACNYYFSKDNKVGLAHFRLSILDLSSAADQPMFSADGRYCIVFNGDIRSIDQFNGGIIIQSRIPGIPKCNSTDRNIFSADR